MHQRSFGVFHEAQSHNLLCHVWPVRKRQKIMGGTSQRVLLCGSLVAVPGEFIASASSQEFQKSSRTMLCAETSGRTYQREEHRSLNSAGFAEHLQKQSSLSAILLDLKTAHKRSIILT